MPILLASLPAALGATLASASVEWGLFGLSAVIGLTSMHLGRRIHSRPTAQIVCAAGLTCLATGRMGEERHWGALDVVALVAGGLFIACAHLINNRLCEEF